jgi:hypothetical protein
MPTLTSKPTPQLIKMFLLGYSGTGKSWSYVSLGVPEIIPGWKPLQLRVLDFDGKSEEVIRSALSLMLKSKTISQAQYDAAFANFDVCVCRENTSVVQTMEGRKPVLKFGVVGTAQAWPKAVKQMQTWQKDWDSDTVLIIDSFTYAAKAIVNFSQELNGRLNQELTWREYQGPQQLAENLMTIVADIPANAIVIGHQDPLELYKVTDRVDDKGEPIKELMDTLVVPLSIGQSGRMKLPAQMNHMLVCSADGSGRATRRYIYTEPTVGVTTKTPFYGRCKDRYQIEKGMAEYFALREQ